MNLQTQKKITLFAISGVMSAFAAAGCSSADESGSADSLELNVGSAFAQSGDLASMGQSADKASYIGADIVNKAAKEADIKFKVKVFSEDTQGQPAQASEAATKLIQSDKASVIVGPQSTAETIPMTLSVGVPNQVPQIAMASSTAIGGVKDGGYLFRTVPSDLSQAKILVDVVTDELGADATVNLGARNDPAGSGFLNAFEKAWEKGGGTVGKLVKWNPSQQGSYDTEAQQLASGNPDGWVLYDFEGTWLKFEPALVRTGKWDPRRSFGGDPLGELPKDLAKEAVGMRGLFIGAKEGPQLTAFNDLWKKEAGGLEQIYAEPQTFDAVILASLAALKGGDTDGATIKENLTAVSKAPGKKYDWTQLSEAMTAVQNGDDIDYEGASGGIDFDEQGDPSSAFYTVWEWQAGGELKVGNSVGGSVK